MDYEIELTTGNSFVPHQGQINVIVRSCDDVSHSVSLGHSLLQPNWSYRSRVHIPIAAPNIKAASLQYVSYVSSNPYASCDFRTDCFPTSCSRLPQPPCVPPPIYSMPRAQGYGPQSITIATIHIIPVYLHEPYRCQLIKRFTGNPNIPIMSNQVVPLYPY